MTKAIFYKEWLKTRRVFFAALAVAVAVAVYAVINIHRIEVVKGVDHIWLIMLMKDQMFIDSLRWLPLLVGIAVGIAQMAPEMHRKQLKLTLHLPYPQSRLVFNMLAVGLIEVVAIFVIQAAIIGGYYSTIVVPELTSRVLLTSLPWYLAGINAYLLVTAICLEGTWRMRVILGLVATGILAIYFMQSAPEAYNGMIALAVIFILLTISLTYRSVYRFKEGHQD